MMIFFSPAAGVDFAPVGSTCVGGDRRPVPLADLVPDVRGDFLKLLPTLNPSFQPSGGGLVHVPVVFGAGQPAQLEDADVEVAGMDVHINATATWSWNFGDGTSAAATTPGGAYPDMDVNHAYDVAGAPNVAVTTTWAGTFTVEGLGPFAIAGDPVTQTATVVVPVREARAHLVAG
jgi:hypothetical protein